ncbi:MAG: diguanylate cyclase [Deltaproteobacteria bacterium]|nr:diguanylate cyclase [Deltaproteobacteria bacterium]
MSTVDPRNPGAAHGAREARGPARADVRRVLVLARGAGDRAWVAAALDGHGFESRVWDRFETLGRGTTNAVDAVVLVVRRASAPPRVVEARLNRLLPGRAVVVLSATPDLPPAEGQRRVVLRWPPSAARLRDAVERALAGAVDVRALDGLGVPPSVRAALADAVALGGSDGQPEWYLEALLADGAAAWSGGAVLTPSGGGYRVLAASGIRESYVSRLVRRHPPPAGLDGLAVRPVRIGRVLRSPASALRALRAWWWLTGPPCAGVGARTFLFRERAAVDAPWADGALGVLVRQLARAVEPPGIDLVTGLEQATEVEVAARACATAGDGTGGAGVVLVVVPALRELRRAHGPRVEARAAGVVAARLGRGLRGTDVLVRLGPERFAVVLPAADEVEASRLARRLRRSLGGDELLRRRGEEVVVAGELEVRAEALFVPEGSDPAELAEWLVRVGAV